MTFSRSCKRMLIRNSSAEARPSNIPTIHTRLFRILWFHLTRLGPLRCFNGPRFFFGRLSLCCWCVDVLASFLIRFCRFLFDFCPPLWFVCLHLVDCYPVNLTRVLLFEFGQDWRRVALVRRASIAGGFDNGIAAANDAGKTPDWYNARGRGGQLPNSGRH